MARGFYRDNIIRCPFCSSPVGEAVEISTRFGNTFSGGKCECGAAFVLDRSGHNLGDAYVDVLTYACNGDWDRAWSLSPDEDYEVREVSQGSKSMSARRRTQATYLFVLVKKGACGPVPAGTAEEGDRESSPETDSSK